MKTSKQEGFDEGKVEGKVEVAVKLIRSALLSDEQISEMTQLTLEEIAALRAEINNED